MQARNGHGQMGGALTSSSCRWSLPASSATASLVGVLDQAGRSRQGFRRCLPHPNGNVGVGVHRPLVLLDRLRLGRWSITCLRLLQVLLGCLGRLIIRRCRYWHGVRRGMCLDGQEAVEEQQKGREESKEDTAAAASAAATADLHGGVAIFMRPA